MNKLNGKRKAMKSLYCANKLSKALPDGFECGLIPLSQSEVSEFVDKIKANDLLTDLKSRSPDEIEKGLSDE